MLRWKGFQYDRLKRTGGKVSPKCANPRSVKGRVSLGWERREGGKKFLLGTSLFKLTPVFNAEKKLSYGKKEALRTRIKPQERGVLPDSAYVGK